MLFCISIPNFKWIRRTVIGVPVSTKMVKIFSIKFTKWIPGSRKIQEPKFVSSLHIYMLFCISIPNFKWIRRTVMGVPMSTKMVKIFSITYTKWILESRKIQEIKNVFFVAHLHVILHPYTKFQMNPMNSYGSSRVHKND